VQLTRREREVAQLIASGLTDKQIATHLVITEGTAGVHVVHSLNKLGFRSRAQVAAWVGERQNDKPVRRRNGMARRLRPGNSRDPRMLAQATHRAAAEGAIGDPVRLCASLRDLLVGAAQETSSGGLSTVRGR
jgi:DNA-binding CsgD family transcriptional regulator